MARYKLYVDKFITFQWEKHILRAFQIANSRIEAFHLFPVNKQWAKHVKARDKICQNCGSVERLQAHHIFSQTYYPTLKYLLNNGVTLCKNCHCRQHDPNHQPKLSFDTFDFLIIDQKFIHKRIERSNFWSYHLPNDDSIPFLNLARLNL